jgi:penicillin-binding protein 2
MAADPTPGPARLSVLGVVAVSLVAALVARLYFLQVLASPEFEVRAAQNQIEEVRLDPVRGRILDRYGRVIADNQLVGQVALDRQTVRRLSSGEQDALFARLGKVLDMTGPEVREAWEDPRNHPQLPPVVQSEVDESTLTYLRERQGSFPGVLAREVNVRVYPYGSLASHVVGYVGEILQTELDARPGEGYEPGDDFGRAGVEKTFEAELRGEPGSQGLEVDRVGNVVRLLDPVEPQRGADVELTLDLDLQRIAETSLAQGLLRARQVGSEDTGYNYPAPGGSVVVLDATNGEVLASASFPDFDPNDFVGGISTSLWRQLSDPLAAAPLNNRAVQGRYAPGSTFKLITALAGLRAHVIDLGTRFNDTGRYVLQNCEGEKCEWTNANDAVYGAVNVTEAITVSSDLYFFDLGARIWQDLDKPHDEVIQQTAALYGIGGGTGIQIPFEQHGRVPTEELKKTLHDESPGAFPFADWFTGDNMNLAVGQGLLVVTPMELANAYATFANGGTLHQLNIARSITAADGEVLRTFEPRVRRDVDLDPVVWQNLLGGLVGVTTNYRGTAVNAFAGLDAPWTVAGKTGTAQEFGISEITGRKKEDTALFVGFAPALDPKWVVAVVMEESGFGGTQAAPVARNIFEQLARLEKERDEGNVSSEGLTDLTDETEEGGAG